MCYFAIFFWPNSPQKSTKHTSTSCVAKERPAAGTIDTLIDHLQGKAFDHLVATGPLDLTVCWSHLNDLALKPSDRILTTRLHLQSRLPGKTSFRSSLEVMFHDLRCCMKQAHWLKIEKIGTGWEMQKSRSIMIYWGTISTSNSCREKICDYLILKTHPRFLRESFDSSCSSQPHQPKIDLQRGNPKLKTSWTFLFGSGFSSRGF